MQPEYPCYPLPTAAAAAALKRLWLGLDAESPLIPPRRWHKVGSRATQPFAKHFHFMLPLAVICRHFVGRSKMSCYFWPNMPHFYLCMLQPPFPLPLPVACRFPVPILTQSSTFLEQPSCGTLPPAQMYRCLWLLAIPYPKHGQKEET